jgi:hypothetical protein
MNSFEKWLDKSNSGQITCVLVIIGAGAFAPPLGILIWLIWKWRLKKKFIDFGLKRPINVLKTIGIGIFLGIFLKLLFMSVVMPLIRSVIIPVLGAEVKTNTFQFLEGNLTALLGYSVFVIISAGLFEEILFRGFLFTRLKKWLGDSFKSRSIIIIMSSLVFGLPHVYQGYFGAIHATLVGSILGILYYVNKGNLWLLIVTHAFFDLFAIFLIYKGWDEIVSNFLF